MRQRLSDQIARRIVDHVRERGLPEGRHLGAQELADAFEVSRAPVTAALKLLAEAGIVRAEPNRGYFVARAGTGPAGRPVGAAPPADPDEEDPLYFTLAEDRLQGRLPARVSENELMRLYGASRSRLQVLLTRIAEEGWVRRLPGHGWEFGSVLSSPEAYEEAYRFRAAIETAAVLQPAFAPVAEELRAARAEQQALLDGDMFRLPRTALFRLNSTFHETVVSWSGNAFFTDALRRVNRLRRLIEYRVTVDRSRLGQQCREHLQILDLLERGEREAAADFLRRHIEHAYAVKRDRVADPAAGPTPV